jgi:eukaryotic-like serine/threonine-protein kinase
MAEKLIDNVRNVLPVAYSTNPEWLRRFEREARAAGQLSHPNVLTVYDVGIHENAPYIVAELLEGEELLALLKRAVRPNPALRFVFCSQAFHTASSICGSTFCDP